MIKNIKNILRNESRNLGMKGESIYRIFTVLRTQFYKNTNL
jgi:hypothetical protein